MQQSQIASFSVQCEELDIIYQRACPSLGVPSVSSTSNRLWPQVM